MASTQITVSPPSASTASTRKQQKQEQKQPQDTEKLMVRQLQIPLLRPKYSYLEQRMTEGGRDLSFFAPLRKDVLPAIRLFIRPQETILDASMSKSHTFFARQQKTDKRRKEE